MSMSRPSLNRGPSAAAAGGGQLLRSTMRHRNERVWEVALIRRKPVNDLVEVPPQSAELTTKDRSVRVFDRSDVAQRAGHEDVSDGLIRPVHPRIGTNLVHMGNSSRNAVREIRCRRTENRDVRPRGQPHWGGVVGRYDIAGPEILVSGRVEKADQIASVNEQRLKDGALPRPAKSKRLRCIEQLARLLEHPHVVRDVLHHRVQNLGGRRLGSRHDRTLERRPSTSGQGTPERRSGCDYVTRELGRSVRVKPASGAEYRSVLSGALEQGVRAGARR